MTKSKAPDTAALNPKQLVSLFMPADEFAAQDIPPRTWLIEGCIPHPSLGMLYAQRGIGKTLCTMDLALALAGGRPWLDFAVPQRRTGLYIDGEMPRADLVQRLKMQANGKPLPSNLHILSAESIALKHWNLNLVHETDRETLSHAIAAWERLNETSLDFIVVDNWTSLIRGIDENDNSQMDAIKAWLILLRHAGVSVILVHHAGKNGYAQRGGSAREDVLDYSIRLRRQANQDDTSFLLEWDKARTGRPEPAEFPVDLIKTSYTIELKRGEKLRRKNGGDKVVLETIRQNGPMSWAQLLELTGLAKGTLHRRIDALLAAKQLIKTKDGTFDVDAA